LYHYNEDEKKSGGGGGGEKISGMGASGSVDEDGIDIEITVGSCTSQIQLDP
jgi:hypothetical protein